MCREYRQIVIRRCRTRRADHDLPFKACPWIWTALVIAGCGMPRFETVATIDRYDVVTHLHVPHLLQAHGIWSDEWSRSHFRISVEERDADRATEVLKRDAARRRYSIRFADGEVVRAPEPVRTNVGASSDQALGRELFASSSPLGAALRLAVVYGASKGFPYIHMVSHQERRYVEFFSDIECLAYDIVTEQSAGPGADGGKAVFRFVFFAGKPRLASPARPPWAGVSCSVGIGMEARVALIRVAEELPFPGIGSGIGFGIEEAGDDADGAEPRTREPGEPEPSDAF